MSRMLMICAGAGFAASGECYITSGFAVIMLSTPVIEASCDSHGEEREWERERAGKRAREAETQRGINNDRQRQGENSSSVEYYSKRQPSEAFSLNLARNR